MKKVLLSYDKRNHETALKMIESDVSILNSLVTTIKENTNKIKITKENIESLIKDPKGFVFDMIVDKSSMNFNGVPISRKKALELVEFPEEFEAIIIKAESAKESLKGSTYTISNGEVDKIAINQLELIENTFILTAEYLNKVQNEFSTYTRNEAQNKAIECIENIFKSINELKDLKFIRPSDIENEGLESLGFRFTGGELLLDLEQVKRLR
jgi:hypothetical protein